MRTKGSAAELEARRRAAEYFQARKSLRTVTRLLDVSLSSVKRWRRAWKAGGVEALAAQLHPGGVSKLSEEKKQELVAILLAGPLAVACLDLGLKRLGNWCFIGNETVLDDRVFCAAQSRFAMCSRRQWLCVIQHALTDVGDDFIAFDER